MLKIRQVSKSFGGLAALTDVTFSVGGGEIKALIGPNGAGKTTMFNLISGLLRPTAGHIEVAGQSVRDLSPAGIARLGLSRTFQQPMVFRTLSVLENVMLGGHRHRPTGFLACGLASPGARAQERRLAEWGLQQLDFCGISHIADRIAGELPLGQQRYVEIARALATNPSLLLMDEPAAGLDDSETEDLRKLALRIRDRGTTILVIEHNMDFVMGLADSIVVLNFGSKLAEGTPLQVRQSQAVVDAYLGVSEDA